MVLSASIAPANFGTLRIDSSGSLTTTAQANTITIDKLAIEVDDEIGATGARISTAVTQLAAESETGGAIFLAETSGGVTVTTVDSLAGIVTANGEIDVTVVGDLTLSQPLTAGGAAASNIHLLTTSSGNINVNASLTDSGNDSLIVLDADGAITQAAATSIAGGSLRLTANNAIGTSGARILTNVGSLSAKLDAAGATGDIFITEANDGHGHDRRFPARPVDHQQPQPAAGDDQRLAHGRGGGRGQRQRHRDPRRQRDRLRSGGPEHPGFRQRGRSPCSRTIPSASQRQGT